MVESDVYKFRLIQLTLAVVVLACVLASTSSEALAEVPYRKSSNAFFKLDRSLLGSPVVCQVKGSKVRAGLLIRKRSNGKNAQVWRTLAEQIKKEKAARKSGRARRISSSANALHQQCVSRYQQMLGTPPATPTPTPTITPTPDQSETCQQSWGSINDGPCTADGVCSVAAATASSDELVEVGPFDTYPADGVINGLTIYVYSAGGGEKVGLTLNRSQYWNQHRSVLRVFDPEERLVYWVLNNQANSSNPNDPFQPVKTYHPDAPPPPAVFTLKKAGIYEIRLSTNSNSRLSLKLTPGTKWGISPQNGQLRSYNWNNHGSAVYAWMQSHPTMINRLTVMGAHPALKIYRDSTNEQLNLSQLTVPAGLAEGGELWRFELPGGDVRYFTGSYGMPLVLTTTKEAAKVIKAASNVIPDGPLAGFIVPHRFQLELAKLLPQVIQEIKLADSAFASLPTDSLQDPACSNPASEDDVFRSASLLGYGYKIGVVTNAAWALNSSQSGKPNQQIDPSKPWLGAFGLDRLGRQACSSQSDCLDGSSCNTGFCTGGFNPEVIRWDVERQLVFEDLAASTPGATLPLRAGISPPNFSSYALAFAATTEAACNPYRESLVGSNVQRSIIARAALSLMIDLMRITESEIILAESAELNSYSAHNLFPLANTLVPKFLMTMKALDQSFPQDQCGMSRSEVLKRTLASGMRRVIDRQLGDYALSTANQFAHGVLAFREFAEAVKSLPEGQLYQSVADIVAQEFLATQTPTGYWVEGNGLDATYAGITHNLLAEYYQLDRAAHSSLAPAIGDALNTSYNMFNHTVAPERSGKLQGGFSFSHRTSAAFNREQYLGAKGIGEDIPNVSIWSHTVFSDVSVMRQTLLNRVSSFKQDATRYEASNSSSATYYLYWNSSERPANVKFPYQEESFERNFGNELIVVKRPTYMTSVFVGKPAYTVNSAVRELVRRPQTGLEDIDPNTDPTNSAAVSIYQNTPFTGGGLSMFWTPEFGSSILGASWSPLVHHGVIATISGKRYWESYPDTNFDWSPERQELVVSGKIENSTISYARSYKFLDDKISVHLELTSDVDAVTTKLVENIPLMTCTRGNCDQPNGLQNRKSRGSTIVGLDDVPLTGQNIIGGLRLLDGDGRGVEVTFDAQHSVGIYPHGMRDNYYNLEELQIGRAEIQLPTFIPAGSKIVLDYSVAPLAEQ